MGLPWWLVTGCAALVGLVAGFWLADSDRERLKKTAAAKIKAAEGRARALEEKELALSQKMQEVAEEEQALIERLREVAQQQASVLEKQAGSPVEGRKKPARGKKAEPENTPRESV